jgi:hypothetical protein
MGPCILYPFHIYFHYFVHFRTTIIEKRNPPNIQASNIQVHFSTIKYLQVQSSSKKNPKQEGCGSSKCGSMQGVAVQVSAVQVSAAQVSAVLCKGLINCCVFPPRSAN